jgi:hypothetical protein
MTLINDYLNRYNILLTNDDNILYIKVIDKNTYSVYDIEYTDLILTEVRCSTLEQLFILVKNAFEDIKKYPINFKFQKNKLILSFMMKMTDFYTMEFQLQLTEHQKTSEKENQLKIFKYEQKFTDMIKNLQKQLNKLSNKVKYNEQVFEQASICIGLGKISNNAGHFSACTCMIPLNTESLMTIIIVDNQSSLTINNGQIKCEKIFWDKFVLLPKLTTLEIRNMDICKFSNLANKVLTNLTLHGYNSLTLDGIESIVTLEELTIVNSPTLKNASDYIKNLPKLKKLTFTTCRGIQVNDVTQLNDYCNQNNIECTIE